MDKLAQEIQLYQNEIISYVYRLTGSVQEAEDITQETFLKYLAQKHEEIKNTKAWLYKVATNLSLDFFRSAKKKRETYIGPWLPEPYIQDQKTMDEEMQLDESLSVALFVMMEKLSSKERIAYILHDVFDFKHKEIAQILNTSEQNSRQLTSRANKKLQNKKNRFAPSKQEHESLTQSFIKALKEGDLDGLKQIFTADVSLYSDGGGKAIAARKVLYGDDDFIGKFLIKVTAPLFKETPQDVQLKTVWFNGSLGIVLVNKSSVVSSYHFEIVHGKIANIYALRNPDKLKFFF
jgi:RNA polymerase sigma-70 factor (ECF subfamily)